MIDASRENAPTALAMRIDAARQEAEAALIPFDPPARREATADAENERYVIPCQPDGYTCLGFDVLTTRYNSIMAWLRQEGFDVNDLPPEARGTMGEYTDYLMLMRRAEAYCKRNNLRCPAELTRQLIGLEGKRVEVVDRYGERRRFQVGKSTGWLPIHLEIPRRDSTGGPAVTGAPFQSVQVVS
jgi:hypothetical protein